MTKIEKNISPTKVVTHTNCRLCNAANMESVISLGSQYINDFPEKKNIGNGVKAPLEIVHCDNCDLAQLKHTAPQELLYSRQYWYRSGVTQTMRRELNDIVNELQNYINLSKDDIVLDIGANDGTMLNYFSDDLIKIGCEPANNLVDELSNNCDRVIHDFWSEDAYLNSVKDLNNKKAKVVTAIGMFYDLDDPVAFVSDIEKVLDDDGIFVAQLMTLAPMLEKNDLGNICHEHIEFYSFKSIKYLFEKNGLEIFKISSNDINGGSYRFYCRKFKRGSIRLPKENILKMMKKFVYRVKMNKRITVNFIKKQIENNKKIFLYGASTKGNTVLQYYGLNKEMIPYAAERSPFKWGKYTIGTGIKIISEKQAKKMKPDFFFVTPWGFIKEFIKREKNWLNNGGKFILPFPNMKIIGRK